MLDDLATDARVDDRVDRARSVALERRGQRIGPALVEDVRERLDAVVAHPAGRVGGQHPGEIAALVEELGRLGQLGADEARDRLGREVGPLRLDAEMRLRDPGGQHAGVVAGAVNGPGVGRHAVLLEALGALADRPAEEDAGHGRALPERGLDRQPALSDGLDTQLGKVEQRRHEPGGGDHVVDLEGEVGAAVGASEADGQPAVGRRARCGRARRRGRSRRRRGRSPRTAARSVPGRRRASSCRPTASASTARRGRAGAPTAAARWRARSRSSACR